MPKLNLNNPNCKQTPNMVISVCNKTTTPSAPSAGTTAPSGELQEMVSVGGVSLGYNVASKEATP